MNFEGIKTLLLKIWALIITVIAGITSLFQGNITDTKTLKLEKEMQFVVDEAFVAAQGLAVDGDILYTSGAISALYMGGLGKIDMNTGEFIDKKLGSIPSEFQKKGYDHIGGIGYLDGKIYAAVEDKAEEYPLVLIYDSNTLEYTGEYYDVTNEALDDGIPWCTVDADNGYLYCSKFRHANEILAYNLTDMTFSHYISLSEEVDRVQAGAYLDGYIYLNLDPHNADGTKEVVAVDVFSGEVKKIGTRNTGGFETETEGIAAYKTENGDLRLIICDYDKTVAIFIREYTFVKNF